MNNVTPRKKLAQTPYLAVHVKPAASPHLTLDWTQGEDVFPAPFQKDLAAWSMPVLGGREIMAAEHLRVYPGERVLLPCSVLSQSQQWGVSALRHVKSFRSCPSLLRLQPTRLLCPRDCTGESP